MKHKRESWVDLAKGIGIILVIAGHACCPTYPHGIIYAFHMPLFFFLSGLFIDKQCQIGFMEFAKKNFRSLLIPYFSFNIISILFHLAILATTGKDLFAGSVVDNFVGIFVCIRWGTPFHHVLWFLPCLFIAKMIIYPIYHNKLTIPIVGGISLILLLSGLFYCSHGKIPLPMSLDAALIASFFIVCGSMLRKNIRIVFLLSKKYWYILSVIALLSVVCNFNNVEMFDMRYGNWIYFISGSLCIILLICIFCYRCNNLSKIYNVVMKYGRLSLLVFATHNYCLFIPITLKNDIICHNNVIADYGYWLGAILFCLILVLPLSSFIDKNAKWLIGK